jgi:glycine cleavage system transcriptional repressor
MPLLVVAALGPDRPGVIAALSEVLLADAGNLEDVSMTILRGQFAMTLVVDTPAGADQVRADLAAVAGRLGLLVSVHPADPVRPEGARPVAGTGGGPFVVRVHGADRPGLVYRVTAIIASCGGNITDLTTRLSDDGLYVLVAELDLPGPPDDLEAGLRALAGELGVAATLSPADPDIL